MADTEGLKRQSTEISENEDLESKRPRILYDQPVMKSQQEDVGKVSSEDLFCACCDLSFSGPVPYQQHLAGKKHKKKMLYSYMNQKEKKVFVDNPLNVESLLTCNLCKIQVTGPEQLQMHLSGKSHKKQEQKLKMENMKKQLLSGNSSEPSLKPSPSVGHFQCEICSLSFSGEIPYNSHMVGKRHMELAKLRETFDKNKSSRNVVSE